jgi:chorismate dehydratase
VPEAKKNVLGVPEASYLRPLLYGLSDSPASLELLIDLPSQLAIKLQQRIGINRCAFLSPIDYARHGGDYLVVPGLGVSSSFRTDTIQLFINRDVRNIGSIAVDLSVTSEIILAKIILAEKFPNEEALTDPIQFIPMLPNREEMLRKADAALMVNFHPVSASGPAPFSLDLVEEWNDLTGLPYVHGIWVGHEDSVTSEIVDLLTKAREAGLSHLAECAEVISGERKISRNVSREYLAAFSYGFGEEEQAGLSEYIRYAYFHGVLPDVPDLNLFDAPHPPPPAVH